MIDFVDLIRCMCMFSRRSRETLYLNMPKILDSKPVQCFKTSRVEVRLNEVVVDPARAESQPRHAVLHEMTRRAKTAFHASAKPFHLPSNTTSAGSAAHANTAHR
jgi:hypothetical protein